MKIQNYALINIQELDEKITELEKEEKSLSSDKVISLNICLHKQVLLRELKSKLIPAEKLASVAFDAGQNGKDEFGEITLNKKDFLTEEIPL